MAGRQRPHDSRGVVVGGMTSPEKVAGAILSCAPPGCLSSTTKAAKIMASDAPTFNSGQRLHEKVCIVTGAASGLGRAIALAYASQGARLVVCADLKPTPKSEFEAEEAGTPTHEVICRRHGEYKGLFVRTDVTIGTEIEALVQEAVKLGGRLDV